MEGRNKYLQSIHCMPRSGHTGRTTVVSCNTFIQYSWLSEINTDISVSDGKWKFREIIQEMAKWYSLQLTEYVFLSYSETHFSLQPHNLLLRKSRQCPWRRLASSSWVLSPTSYTWPEFLFWVIILSSMVSSTFLRESPWHVRDWGLNRKVSKTQLYSLGAWFECWILQYLTPVSSP